MPKTLIFLVIGLFFGAGLGFLTAASSGAQLTAHDHGAHNHGTGEHEGHSGHGQMIEAEVPVPTLVLHILPDGVQSRNLHIMTQNFTFSPTGVNGGHVPGHGHAHIYVNGVKQPRAYSEYVHLDALPSGTHEIRVTLNANTHGYLAVGGAPIEATTSVTIE